MHLIVGFLAWWVVVGLFLTICGIVAVGRAEWRDLLIGPLLGPVLFVGLAAYMLRKSNENMSGAR